MTEQNGRQVQRPVWLGYAVAVLLVVALTAGLMLLDPVFPLGKYPIPYVLLVMVTAYFFGGGPAVVTGVMGWLAFTALFVPPAGFTWPPADSPEGWAREVAFFLGVTVVAIAAIQVRNANRRIRQLADESMGLNESLKEEIAERKLVEEALRESEEQFRTMASAMPQLAWIANADGFIFWYNQRWYEYTGTTPEQMEGWGWQSVHDPEMLPEVMERWKASIVTGEPFDMEFPLRGADGRFRWFLTRIFPLKDAEGRVMRWFGTNTDVSERREAEEALREQARMLDLAHVLVRDMEGRIVFWNKGAEMLYGYTRECAVGKDIYSLLQTRFPVPLEKIMSELLDTGEWEGELMHRSADGSELAIFSHWMLHRDKDGNPYAIIETNNDITELKRAEEELRKLTTELEQRVSERTSELQVSNRELEAAYKEMQTLSYSIMHDLRTPLRAMGGFSDALLKHYADLLDARGQDYLQRIGTAAQRMSQIIDDIHELLRATRAKLDRQDVDMSAMAVEIIDQFRKSQPGRRSEITVEPDLIANADPDLLRVALENLLGNAWKFTSGREVTRIQFTGIELNGKRVYVIRDNGVGFDPAYTDKLFTPFQRLHNESDFPGTGIGLALAERILRRHGGKIWAESEVDKGAAFYFTFGETDK